MSEIISTSVSAAAIFSALDILGGPPNRKDIVVMCFLSCFFLFLFGLLVRELGESGWLFGGFFVDDDEFRRCRLSSCCCLRQRSRYWS